MASYTYSESQGFLPRPGFQVQGNPFYTSTDERPHVLQAQAVTPRRFMVRIGLTF